jgi:hypothetical protein
MTNKQRWIYQQVAEMSAILGISVPEIKIVGVDATPEERHIKYMHAWWAYNDRKERKIVIKTRSRTPSQLRHTIAHELIHLAFPKLQHETDRFEEYIKALLKGHMAFDRRGLITEVVKPPPSTDNRIRKLEEQKKRWQTRLKRATTAIKKIDKKIRCLESKIIVLKMD